MSYGNFISLLSRKCFSINAYNSRFLLKNNAHASFLKNNYRCYRRLFKITIPNFNLKSTLNIPKLYGVSNKIIVSFYLNYGNYRHIRWFHTSERRYLHPILWTVLRPVLKFLAIITGRAFRKWWKDLPPNKKRYFLKVVKENKHKIAIFAIACASLSAFYYISHLEETPITKRRRFMAFNSKQLRKINELEFQQITQKMQHQILPANHPSTLRVKAIVNRILIANKDIEEIKDKKWGISVINSSVENAFVLPIGQVFVFTGMLSLCSNDDELAIILSHEIAHCLQNHGAENISMGHLLDLISIAIIAAIWALIPSDSLSLFSHWLYAKFVRVFFELPYNRNIEKEADAVGLQLAAKACFDVRESSAFWAKMAYLHNLSANVPNIEFLSTHPSHETRSIYLDSLMNQAINLRYECGCPKLKTIDPRLNVEIMAKALDASRRKYLQQFPKPVVQFHL